MLEDEARNASPKEKAVLVKYTGWGAFAQDMFAAYKDTYKEERQAFRSLVTDEEYEAARASTLNAHYTSPDVVKGMWDALVHFGYDGGLAIEPSAGSGNFIGMTPDSVAPRTAWTGVELDPLTGKIAKALYGGAEINIQGFETLKRPSNYYDVAISNVPFGDYNLKEKPYGSHAIHDFFFVKSLDKVRPGGMVAFVTSRFTMDKLDPAVRRLLSKSADLVGAIRLPGGNKGAFAGNAGTAVTTDIMFLRKRVPGEQPFPGADWLNTKEIQTPDGPATINEYFADHPDMMLGEMRLTRGMYRDNEPTLVGLAEGLHEKILEAARKMPEGAFTEREAPPPPTLHSNDIGSDVKDGAFFVQGGKVYKRVSGQGVEQSFNATDQDRITRLTGLRDIVNELLTTQLATGEGAKEKSEVLRKQLRTAYDAFVKKHGPINKEVRTVTSRLNKQGEPIVSVRYPNMAEFRTDPDAFKVSAIEHYDAETGNAERATIQTKDVISAPTKREINGPSDALAAVLDEKGRVDLQTIGDMIGAKTEDEVVSRMGDMIYQNPDGRQWEPADKYLSGDVVQKLEEARAIAASEPAYLRNVVALEKVQPTPLEPHDIAAQFGAPWVPQDVYEDFLKAIGAGMPVVRRVPVTAEWKVDARGWSRDATAKYGTDRTSVKDIVDVAMNNRQVTVYDTHEDGSKSVNQDVTDQARVKIANLKEAFTGDQDAGIDSWVWQDPDRAERLAAIYNRTFNNVVARKFDGSHQTFPGMSAELKLRPHQANAVWRIVQKGNTLLAHVVGSGKTFTMIASGMEQKRLGLINKPMYVVPNHMLEQFSREFLQAYPDAKILVAQKDEMTRDLRKAFISKVAANDWDGVVITHDAFGRINMDVEFRKQYVRDQMDELERVLVAEAQENGDKAPTVKALEKIKKNLQTRMEELLNESRKDEGTSFEESGVDFLYVDEAHLYKNLSFLTRLQRVKGLSQGNSQRAEDLFLKMRYLEQKRPGRSAVFATGTPVSNTMAEIWTMMRYLELDKLKERGLDNFDAWASTFGKVVNNTELSADGRTFKDVASFSRFVNVPELISLYSEIADTQTADMLKLPRPELKTRSGAPGIEISQAEPSDEEEAYINHLVALAESIKGSRPEKGKPNMLSVVTSGRKVATDGRLVDPQKFSFNPEGKIAKAIQNISRIYKEGKEPGLAQMVFLDMGVPTSGMRPSKAPTIDEDGNLDPTQTEAPKINLYDDLKQRLVAEGIPSKEIAFIHDANDDEKKAKLFAKVRSGEVRIIIGSTSKMGVGTNVQKRLIAMHHLDAPWKPADLEQRDGRILRQGNLNPEVQIYRYVTKRSFDAFMWQKLDTKAKFISQVLSGAKGSRHAEDVDNPLPEAAEMKAAASGDPRIMEHADLTRQVRALAGQKRAFDATVSRATSELKSSKSRIADLEASLGAAQSDAARVTDISGDKFSAKLGTQTYDSRKDAGAAIVAKITAMPIRDFYRSQDLKIGEMSGFDMHLEVGAKWSGDATYLYARPSLVGDARYSAPNGYVLNEQTDPVQLMRRFEGLLNQVAAQPDRIELGMAGERKNIENLSQTLQAKWPRENEYAEAQKRLADLNAAMKKKDQAPPTESDDAAADPAETQTTESRELYQSGYKGKIRLAPGKRPIITLMRDADASTFIHETGHQFLDELERDARHPMAPSTIRQDWKTTQDWLGVKEGQTVPTRAHEKFAKGFEQYMREGVAPSKELAGVFAKFKNWLMQIYRSVRGLGQPINEDIRGVFDRMLSTEPQRTVIAPERNMPLSLADIHEQDAAETDPAEAEPVMDRVIAETNNYITQQPPEVANARAAEPAASAIDKPPTGPADDAAGENSDGASRTTEMGNSGSNPDAKPAIGGVRPQRKPVVQSGSQAGSEGAGVSGPEQRPANQPNTGPLAPRPAERFPDAEPDLTDKAGNIRVENLTDQAEVAQAIHDSAERNADFSAVRGQMTKGQMMDLANSMGLDASKLDEATLGRLLGGTADLGAKVLAARKLVVQSAAIVSAAMKKAAEGTPEDTIRLAAAITRHDMIQSALAGVTAEWGRAGNAFHSLLGGWDKAQDINQFLRDNTGRDLFQLQRIAKLGAQLEDGGQVSKFVRDSTKRSFGRGILEYWINGLISGVQTHVTYTVGNGILWAERNLIETPLAAGIGAARSMVGRTGEVIPFGEAAARARGAVRAIPGATKSVVDAIRTGRTVQLPHEGETPDTPFSTENLARPEQYNPNTTALEAVGAAFGLVRGMRDGLVAGAALLKAGGVDGSPLLAWQQTENGVIPDLALRGVNVLPVGTLARMPSRMVAAIHSFFRAINYSTEISGQAYRQAAAEGLAGLARDGRVANLRQNPTPDMMTAAISGSNDLTLMGQGGKFTQKMAHLTNMEFNLPFLGETQLLKFINPFVRVSSNIIDQSLVQRTPLGILSPEIRADLMGKNGNIAQDTASAKMLAGTAMGVIFGTLASQGFASGSGPSDPKRAAMWRLAGNQAHSIRIGDIWYQVNRLGPMGMLMSMAADMYDIGHQVSKSEYDLAGSSIIHAITQNILDEGFMAGPAEWIEAIENSQTKGPAFVRNFLSSFLPYSVGMAQMARAMDPYARQTRTILDALKAKIPGLSESLLPRRDIWGEPIPNSTALGGRALTAIYEQQVGTDPVNQAMLNLGIALGQPDRKIRNVTLNQQQYDDFTRIAGRMTKMRLDAIVRSPNFATWPPDVKHDVIMETVSQCREVARGIMMQKYPSIAVAATQARLLKSQGIPIDDQ
ncbi:MAG: hypothetical protein B7Z71_03895 [Acidocella sp. 21-58-7]|nr:MAG: hypothetical protein B7Z71_03895 [Acidocella sp. 21-58-7]